MPLDAQNLRDFYASPLGDLARRLIGRIVRARWLGAAGLTVAALGYGSPYLDRFRDTATRCLALMPAQQGAAVWPEPDVAPSRLSTPTCCRCRTTASIGC